VCRRLFLASTAALLALVLAACSDDSKAERECLHEAYNAAEAAAVGRAYENRKLGTRKQVESELSGPPGGGASFFDDAGHLIPYRRLDLHHKNQFIIWMRVGRVATITEDARAQARANADPDC
jgi:hypothetical protein